MQPSRHLALAVHILLCVGLFQRRQPVTSTVLAQSTGIHPVEVRKLITRLKKAGLVTVTRGRMGMYLGRPLCEITLYDVFQAAETQQELFPLPQHPGPDCPVGRHIRSALREPFHGVELAMKKAMEQVTLDRMQKEIGLLEKENRTLFLLTTDL